MVVAILVISCLAIIVYAYHANNALKTVPPEVQKLSPGWTREQILEASETARTAEEISRSKLSPKQNRRYIVVGGSGLVGGWIVQHLLWRGESPSAIRILDIAPPARPEARALAFVRTDVTDPKSVDAAFAASWPPDVRGLPLTVFHCAALLRFQDRNMRFIDRCWRVNVDGTRHVLDAAKASGVDCFVATSSGSVAMKQQGYFVPPWSRIPKNLVQFSQNGEPESIDAPPEKFNTCYAATKARMEGVVHESKSDAFRTGCIRPAHVIYGQGVRNSNSATWAQLIRQGGPTWLSHYRLQYVHALNVSLAHLALENRLLANPGISGRSFAVTEDDVVSYGDYYLALTTLAASPMKYQIVPPLPIVVVCYLVEAYVLLRARFVPFLPAITGDLDLMQPATLFMSSGHFYFSIDQAKDDLGYEPAMGTLEGMCITLRDWNEHLGTSQGR